MARLFANNATSTLASGISDSDNTILLAPGEGARFPSPTGDDYFDITLTQGVGLETSWEIGKCTARSGDTLTVMRAQEGTSAASWAAGSKVELRITKGGLDGKQDAMTEASQEEMESGEEAALRSMSPLLVAQAIAALASGGISAAATITSSTTLTSGSAGYQRIAMTSMGQSVTLPDATTLSIGAPKFYFDNSAGGYPVGIRDSTGVLLMAIAAGGTAYANCEDISTAAGVWAITGTNLEPGLITIDNTFSSTYSGTVLKPFVALDDNKSIHFLRSVSGSDLYAVAVDSATKSVGTPILVSTTSTSSPRSVFKVTATTAILFYLNSSGYDAAVVISLSGATTLSVGTPAANGTVSTNWGGEDFSGAPKIAQLSSTLYLASYTNGGGAPTSTASVAISVSGTAVTIGSPANIIASNSIQDSTTTYALTATTGLVLYKSGASAPYANNAVVISVSGTTCAVGTPSALTNVGSSVTGVPSSCLLSATKILVGDNNNTSGTVHVGAFTISGTTVTAGTHVVVETGMGTTFLYTDNSATRYNPHLFPLSTSTALLWYFDGSSVSRAVVLSESGGTVTKGTINYRGISSNSANNAGYGLALPQGNSEFMVLAECAASTAGYLPAIRAYKINGTSITPGAQAPITPVIFNGLENHQCARFSSGIYLLITAGMTGSAAHVFSSNGDAINFRGSLLIPSHYSQKIPLAAVSSNRAVILSAIDVGSNIGASATPIRLLNVEIAK